jgi:hypothetical protein
LKKKTCKTQKEKEKRCGEGETRQNTKKQK